MAFWPQKLNKLGQSTSPHRGGGSEAKGRVRCGGPAANAGRARRPVPPAMAASCPEGVSWSHAAMPLGVGGGRGADEGQGGTEGGPHRNFARRWREARCTRETLTGRRGHTDVTRQGVTWRVSRWKGVTGARPGTESAETLRVLGPPWHGPAWLSRSWGMCVPLAADWGQG